jgi:hypothetical protein
MNTPRNQAIRKWLPSVAICLLVGLVFGQFGLDQSRQSHATTVQAQQTAQIKALVRLIRTQQKTNATKVSDAKRAVDILTDCLTPGGKCYERGQKNQANLLGIVGDIFRYTLECDQDPSTPHNDQAQKQCVALLMEEHHAG